MSFSYAIYKMGIKAPMSSQCYWEKQSLTTYVKDALKTKPKNPTNKQKPPKNKKTDVCIIISIII